MGLGSFRGGIHPPGNKELSKDSPIQAVKPGKELVYLLSQHIGAPARPLVKKGDRVLAGQKIAEAAGFVSVPVYASVSRYRKRNRAEAHGVRGYKRRRNCGK